MCAVSMIVDHFNRKWGEPPTVRPPTTYPAQPIIRAVPTSPLRVISEEAWQEFQELRRKAAEYDERTKQIDCEKPELEQWEQRMHAYLVKIGVLKD